MSHSGIRRLIARVRCGAFHDVFDFGKLNWRLRAPVRCVCIVKVTLNLAMLMLQS